jgi:hypothetical protein
MRDELKPLMDELALVLLKIVETAAFAAVSEVKVEGNVADGKRQRKYAPRKVTPRPCPVCQQENTRRLFSYLCKEHSTKENLAQYKGWMKAKVADAAAA